MIFIKYKRLDPKDNALTVNDAKVFAVILNLKNELPMSSLSSYPIKLIIIFGYAVFGVA
jgi:hypothetical protein